MGWTAELRNAPVDFARSLRMNRKQALIWLCSWWCWTLASMGFYILPYTLSDVAKSLGVPQSEISEANTTSMLSRSIGAVIFGVLADQYGRRMPLIADLILIAVFTLCSGFVHTYGQFVGCRFLFGVAYGGMYGMNMAAVLEAVPREARGAVAGFTQQGFAAGNMIASGIHLGMNKYGWRSVYYLGAGLMMTGVVLRLLTPYYSVTADAVQEAEGGVGTAEEVDESRAVGGGLPFWKKFRYALRYHWPILIYCIVLTSCFNLLGHGSMDVYPTFLLTQKGLDVLHETWVTIVCQWGGVLGGLIGGYLSKYNPKWVPAFFALAIAPWIPLWILPGSWSLLALGAFWFQFSYGASIGTIGNIMQMVCPHPGIRAAFAGVAYNLGNAVSSIAPTVETKLGEDYPLPNGTPDYARTQMILAGVVIALLFITLSCMPKKNMNLEWDQEDPNQEIPSGERHTKDIEMGDPLEDSKKSPAESGADASHIENIEIEGAKA
ncbi:major facilitator superfamily domain-containing protein [Xylariales sp. PMI_506]|nr:major facilitator superfamily domain-containing protein [Xylariales sp. PMI_506]